MSMIPTRSNILPREVLQAVPAMLGGDVSSGAAAAAETRSALRRLEAKVRRREHMVGVNMVGVNMAFHDAICECFEGTMLEPCLLKPCVQMAGRWPAARLGSWASRRTPRRRAGCGRPRWRRRSRPWTACSGSSSAASKLRRRRGPRRRRRLAVAWRPTDGTTRKPRPRPQKFSKQVLVNIVFF